MSDTFTSIGGAAAGVVRRLSREAWVQEIEPVLTAISFRAAAAAREAAEARRFAGMVHGKLPEWDTFPVGDLDTAERELSRALDTVRETLAVMRTAP